jgi:5-methylcytosine-specific restriction endonuclease McrA
METKICTKCKVEKPFAEFYKKKATKDGYRQECKECTKAVNRKYTDANAEKVAEIKREYKRNNKEQVLAKEAKYREQNREEVRRRSREWGRNNADKRGDYQKRYYSVNKEYISARNKEYRKANPLITVMKEQRRRSLKRQLPNTFTKEQWAYSLEYFENSCCYCGSTDGKLQQEHVISLSKGGGYVASNIIPACSSCNQSKNNSALAKWYPKSMNFSEERFEKIERYISEMSGGDVEWLG